MAAALGAAGLLRQPAIPALPEEKATERPISYFAADGNVLADLPPATQVAIRVELETLLSASENHPDGLRVYLTLDRSLQTAAQELAQAEESPVALVCLEQEAGAVRALLVPGGSMGSSAQEQVAVRSFTQALSRGDSVPALPSVESAEAGQATREAAAAYATLARGGLYHPTTLIQRVTNERGEMLYQADQPETPFLAAGEAWKIASVLQRTTALGGSGKLAAAGFHAPAVAQSGRGEGGEWLVGYTSSLTCGLWKAPTYTSALTSWAGFMQKASRDRYAAGAFREPAATVADLRLINPAPVRTEVRRAIPVMRALPVETPATKPAPSVTFAFGGVPVARAEPVVHGDDTEVPVLRALPVRTPVAAMQVRLDDERRNQPVAVSNGFYVGPRTVRTR